MSNHKNKLLLFELLLLFHSRRNHKKLKISRPRRFWIQPAYLNRVPDGEFYRIYLPMKRLAAQGEDVALRRFYQYVRMDFEAFMKLLELLREK